MAHWWFYWWYVFAGNAFSLVEYDVPCDHTTEVCECPETNNDNKIIEVCRFVLDVDLLHTFTRYELRKRDDSKDSRGLAGRVWYIDNSGVERPYVGDGASNTMCGEDVTDGCTEAFYVDGYAFRSFIGVNSRLPGPTIIVNQYQLLLVEVNNRLASENISIHWHGMHQRNSNWMDGVEHVTQCGILPGGSFTYIFNATQPGTHWYHSHSGAQRTDGLFGALVVREKAEDITRVKGLIGEFEDEPESHTLTLWDWQKSNSIDLFTKIHSGIRHFEQSNGYEFNGNTLASSVKGCTESVDGAEVGPWPVTFWSGLINGRGWNKFVNILKTRLSIFTVSPGLVYRFRLVGAQSLYAFRFSIDHHKLKLIATDGVFVNQYDPVDFIIIHSGEHYDFLLEAKTVSQLAAVSSYNNNFMIRAETLEFPSASNEAVAILNYNISAVPTSSQYNIIRLHSKAVSTTCNSNNMCTAINCPFKSYRTTDYIKCINIDQLRLLEPFGGELPDGGSDKNKVKKLFFNFGFEGASQTSAINGRNLRLPAAPLIQQQTETCDLSREGSEKCDKEIDFLISSDCYCTYVEKIDSGISVELILSAVGPSNKDNFRFAHSVHLHGHYFHVVYVGYGEYDSNFQLDTPSDDIECRGENVCVRPRYKTGSERVYDDVNAETGKINSLTPVKDTVMVPYGGYVVVYFKADNPGYWFLHCHIEVHQLEGMGLIIQEGDPALYQSAPPDFPTCGIVDYTAKELVYIDGTSTDTATNKYCSFLIVLTIVIVSTFILFMANIALVIYS